MFLNYINTAKVDSLLFEFGWMNLLKKKVDKCNSIQGNECHEVVDRIVDVFILSL
jgi:hypothetical protein